MNAEEFLDQVEFAARRVKDISGNEVKVLVEVGRIKVVLGIKEIGFNDKEGKIYIEASNK